MYTIPCLDLQYSLKKVLYRILNELYKMLFKKPTIKFKPSLRSFILTLKLILTLPVNCDHCLIHIWKIISTFFNIPCWIFILHQWHIYQFISTFVNILCRWFLLQQFRRDQFLFPITQKLLTLSFGNMMYYPLTFLSNLVDSRHRLIT